MKKSLLFLIVALVSASAHAQYLNAKGGKNHSMGMEVKTHTGHFKGAALWENNFDNPSDWIISNKTLDNQNWVIGTQIPSGEFKIAKIKSTSGGNFALFDSDMLGSNGNVQDADLTIATPINLTGHAAVSVQFEEYYKKYQDKTFIEVSTNNVDWESFEVNDIDVNEYVPGNPTLVRVDISSVAANQPLVWIRFNFQGSWDYAWMVDDVKIVETPANDIAITSVHVDNGGSGQFFEYGEMPLSQAHMLIPYFVIENKGGVTQNVSVNVSVKKDGAAFGSYDLPNPIVLAPGVDSTVSLNAFVPTQVGNYQYIFTASTPGSSTSDENQANNVMKDSLYVTTQTWGDKECQTFGGEAYSFLEGGAGTAYANLTVGQAFQVFNTGTKAIAITTVFASTQQVDFTPDQPVYVELNRFTNAAQFSSQFSDDAFSLVASADEYVVSAGDITPYNGTPVYKTISFTAPADLTPGIYFATIHGLGGDYAYNVGLGANRNTDGSGLLKGDVGTAGVSEDEFIGYGDITPFIKLKLTDATGINKKKDSGSLTLTQNSPNPFTNSTQINYQLKTSGNVLFQVVDITGKIVKRMDLSGQSQGSHTITLNSSEFGAGVYFYSLTTGGVTETKKMVISQ